MSFCHNEEPVMYFDFLCSECAYCNLFKGSWVQIPKLIERCNRQMVFKHLKMQTSEYQNAE